MSHQVDAYLQQACTLLTGGGCRSCTDYLATGRVWRFCGPLAALAAHPPLDLRADLARFELATSGLRIRCSVGYPRDLPWQEALGWPVLLSYRPKQTITYSGISSSKQKANISKQSDPSNMKHKELRPREETKTKMHPITRGAFLAIVNKATKTPFVKPAPKSS
jgi:hypothetical protein